MAVFVFDLDDTLYKEHTFVSSGRHAVANYIATLTALDAAEVYAAIARFPPTSPEAFDRAIELAAEAGISVAVDDILAIYRSHLPEIRLRTDAYAILTELKAAGHSLALVTDGRSETQRQKIRALGLEKFFPADAIFISEEIGGDKTTTVPVEAVERRFPGEVRRFYIGDSLFKDFRHPRLHGWRTVMLADSAGENIFPQRMDAHGGEFRPNTVVFDLRDIPRF